MTSFFRLVLGSHAILLKALELAPAFLMSGGALISPIGFRPDCSYNTSMTTRISAREFHRSIGEVSKRARVEPVVITNQGSDDLVLLSASEYARLQSGERRVHLTSEFPDDLLELVKRSEMDPSHAHLDAELVDWTP
jgi:prevent-host-death family protein